MRKDGKKAVLENLQYTSLYLPALLVYCLFVIMPLCGAIYYSMTDFDVISEKLNFIGLANYRTLITDIYVLNTIGNTFKYTISVTIFQNIFSLVLAVALTQSLRTQNILRTMIFMPSVLSPLIVGYIWSFLYSGPFMRLGKFLGISFLANNVLASREFAIYAASFATIWRMSGWTMVVYIAGLQAIPRDLYDAADVDGIGPLQKFRHITFPMLAPAFTVNVIITFERGLKDFDSIFALTGGGPGDATLIMALSIYKEAFFFSRAGYGTTIGIVLFILIAVLSIIQLRYLRRREENVLG
jgi:raffinose/stachyose/melibiose transport system permease protein